MKSIMMPISCRKALFPALVLCFAAVVKVDAQVEVSCRTEHKTLLQHEPAWVQVELVNETGSDIELNATEDGPRLTFRVDRIGGLTVRRRQFEPVPLTIPARDRITRDVNLLKRFNIGMTGAYTVRARVIMEGQSFVSGPVYIDVVSGSELSVKRAQLGLGGPLRTLSLRSLQRDRRRFLFLRIDSADRSSCYGVVRLGSYIAYFDPQLAVDREGRVHVLHQAGPEAFVQTVITADGRVVEVERFATRTGRPRLVQEVGGQVRVSGLGTSRQEAPEEQPSPGWRLP